MIIAESLFLIGIKLAQMPRRMMWLLCWIELKVQSGLLVCNPICGSCVISCSQMSHTFIIIVASNALSHWNLFRTILWHFKTGMWLSQITCTLFSVIEHIYSDFVTRLHFSYIYIYIALFFVATCLFPNACLALSLYRECWVYYWHKNQLIQICLRPLHHRIG